jgi:uncharacterized membrane protein YagU involved in acid resistance
MRVVLLGGLTAAALDLVYVFVVYGMRGVMPITILQSIASGWLGEEAYELGWSSALLGLASHVLILCVAAMMYGYVSSRSSYVTRHAWMAGALYGLLIFAAMNFVIVPLSAADASLPQGGLLLGSLCAHVLLVGIPIGFIARRATR